MSGDAQTGSGVKNVEHDVWKENVWTAKLAACAIVILGLIAIVGSHTQTDHEDIARQRAMTGFWGPVTATIDWCEANYDISHYTAEFWNTTSNIFFISYALFGELRFIVNYFGIASIGFGSAFFHATLLFEAQLCDELPMFYFMLALLYITLEHYTVEPTMPWLPPFLAIFAAGFTIAYYIHPFPIFFQIFWGTLTAFTIFLIIQMVKSIPPSDRFVLRSSVYALIISVILWIYEQAFCSPFVRVFRLHAWWHFGTAYAAYVCVTGVLHVRCRNVLKLPNTRIEWFAKVLPYVAYDRPVLPVKDKQN